MFINIADLKDPNDIQGRTYREVNNSTPHKFEIGILVEIEGGVRMFVGKHTRDCDGTPLYCLTPEIKDEYPYNEIYFYRNVSGDGMVSV